ncbi:hypothetical protein B5M09_013452 [Aphanomyces astaci]|uniref:Retroviral polymerase SH3-like domain-containing protein n=1 Tax=Aphanomyces astaci TaxID=112090 RepID=A0A3R7Y0F1_APHAT|nr:hypothetical protein B5M09_013452 [Aphanomyces astaci]
MKVFGCVAYNMIKDPSRRDKLASKAAKCVFLGYSKNVKALELYDLAANKSVTGFHVRFHETEFLGERAKIDDYVVTRDDDDDEEDDEIDTSDDSDERDAGHAAWVSTQETNDTPDETKDCLPPDHETVTLAFDGLEIPCAAFPSPDNALQMISTYIDVFTVVAKTAGAVDAIINQVECKLKLKGQGELHYL